MSTTDNLADDRVPEDVKNSPLAACSVETSDLELIIAKGVENGRFSQISTVGVFGAGAGSKCWEPSLNDEGLAKRLEAIQAQPAGVLRNCSLFIPWALHDRQLAITPESLSRICSAFSIPALFIDGVMEPMYWVKPGNGLFLDHDANGTPSTLAIFYRYSFGLRSGRAYIFTRYDFHNNVTTNVCVNCIPEAQTRWIEKIGVQVALSKSEQPLALHSLLIAHSLNYWNKDGSLARETLIRDELGTKVKSPKVNSIKLHDLAQKLHILLEDLSDLEERIMFLIKASGEINKALAHHSKPFFIMEETYMLEYLLSKCKHSKRWVSNYRDRANIRINLAFNLSSQVDNELNVKISKATTSIARDAQRDSSSMITIAAVTMFFLPGTFMSAVFSMVFFNFQQDANGQQEFQVSEQWWYFLAATIPLTCVVFAVWIVWQRIRFRHHRIEDDASNYLTDGEELGIVEMNGEKSLRALRR